MHKQFWLGNHVEDLTGSLKITLLNYLKPKAVQSQQTHSRQNKQFVYVHTYRDKWVPVTTAWRVQGLRMEERPPIWWVTANILNKNPRTTDKGWSSCLGVGRGAKYSSP